MALVAHEPYDRGRQNLFTGKQQIEKDFRHLAGLLEGIAADGIIFLPEHDALSAWVASVEPYAHRDPYRQTILEIQQALNDHFLSMDEVADIRWLCEQYSSQKGCSDLVTAGIQTLTALLQGVTIDGRLNEKEVRYLNDWLDGNEYLRNAWPYDECYALVTRILSDNVVTAEELRELQAFARTLTHDGAKEIAMTIEMLNEGYCQIDPEIIFKGHRFCITGLSKRYQRTQLANLIEGAGGFVTNSVSSNLHYLVVCDEKSTCWAYTCYGRKIEKAVALRKAGHRLAIVHEFDLLDAIQ